MPPIEPTHGDILVQIGELKGQVQTLITLVGQKREDLNQAFSRLGELEQHSAPRVDLQAVEGRLRVLEARVAQGLALCLVVSFALPLALPYLRHEAEEHAARAVVVAR
jgi:hypothetical protein